MAILTATNRRMVPQLVDHIRGAISNTVLGRSTTALPRAKHWPGSTYLATPAVVVPPPLTPARRGKRVNPQAQVPMLWKFSQSSPSAISHPPQTRLPPPVQRQVKPELSAG